MNRSRSRGTASSSRGRTSRPQSHNISKYFSKNSDTDSSESPYKKRLTEMQTFTLNDSVGELDHFKTPAAINKVSKVSKAVRKCVKKRKRKGGCAATLRKFVEANFRYDDVDPDHLQMALACSESSYQGENPEEALSAQVKMESFKTALERFGFGYGGRKNSGNSKDTTELAARRTKKSRYRYITPILHIRTHEERQALIASKLTLIFIGNDRRRSAHPAECVTNLFSEILENFRSYGVFHLNRLRLDELNGNGRLCVKGLGVEPSPPSCGCLLKDWGRIAGRDVSPQRNAQACPKRDEMIARPSVSQQIGSSAHLDVPDAPTTPIKLKTGQGSPTVSPLKNCILSSTAALNNRISPNSEGKAFVSFGEDFVIPETPSGFETPPETSQLNECSKTSKIFDDDNTFCKNTESSFRSISPDLFESDDEVSQPSSPEPSFTSNEHRLTESHPQLILDEELECYDLTQSDEENEGHIAPNDDESEESNLNVTNYVIDLLNSQKSPPCTKKLERISSSEESITISDDELNYSSAYCTPHSKRKVRYDISDDDDAVTLPSKPDTFRPGPKFYQVSPIIKHHSELSGIPSRAPHLQINKPIFLESVLNSPSQALLSPTPKMPQQVDSDTPHKPGPSHRPQQEHVNKDTPEQGGAPPDFIIKTSNVTPMANYDDMNTPEIERELDQFGLKPLRRKRGVKLLKYIYDSTHPFVKDRDGKVVKKRKTDLVGQVGEEEGELLFERVQKKWVASCRVPLHIVWYNFVMSNPRVRESVLLYEPLQLEVVHSMLKDQGYKFNVKDLITFLDKKCITFRTTHGKKTCK